jgi:ABC-type lipoprotein release transport system permease subunit
VSHVQIGNVLVALAALLPALGAARMDPMETLRDE